jgi:hypothetical protein
MGLVERVGLPGGRRGPVRQVGHRDLGGESDGGGGDGDTGRRGRGEREAPRYFARKAEAECIIAASGIPYTSLRAAQFHDLALKTVRRRS